MTYDAKKLFKKTVFAQNKRRGAPTNMDYSNNNKIEDGPELNPYEIKSNEGEKNSWFRHISFALVAGFLVLFATLSISTKSFKNIKVVNLCSFYIIPDIYFYDS